MKTSGTEMFMKMHWIQNRPTRWACLFVFLLMMTGLTGCPEENSTLDISSSKNSGEQTPADMEQNKTPEVADGAEIPADAVTVREVDRTGFDKAIAAYTGKVVLVDYWATYCIPCQTQFPHTVKLSRDLRDKGLAVVSMSMDYPSDKEKVVRFLRDQEADFENLMNGDEDLQQSAAAFELPGNVPLYRLFDRKGKLRYEFGPNPDDLTNGLPIEDIDKKVAELLAEQPTEG